MPHQKHNPIEKCCIACYGRQETSAGGGVYCNDSSCKCHSPRSDIKEVVEQVGKEYGRAIKKIKGEINTNNI